MSNVQVKELKEAYYDYVVKIPNGIEVIIDLMSRGQLEKAYLNIANLAEGLEFLLIIENALIEQNLVINSRIHEAVEIFSEINAGIEAHNNDLLISIFERELLLLFTSASEWVFIEKL